VELPKPLLLFVALLLCGLAGFCLFGFLATFEPLDTATVITWRITYGILGLLSILGLVLVGRIWGRRSRGVD